VARSLGREARDLFLEAQLLLLQISDHQIIDGGRALRLFDLIGKGLMATAELVKARRQRHV